MDGRTEKEAFPHTPLLSTGCFSTNSSKFWQSYPTNKWPLRISSNKRPNQWCCQCGKTEAHTRNYAPRFCPKKASGLFPCSTPQTAGLPWESTANWWFFPWTRSATAFYRFSRIDFWPISSLPSHRDTAARLSLRQQRIYWYWEGRVCFQLCSFPQDCSPRWPWTIRWWQSKADLHYQCQLLVRPWEYSKKWSWNPSRLSPSAQRENPSAGSCQSPTWRTSNCPCPSRPQCHLPCKRRSGWTCPNSGWSACRSFQFCPRCGWWTSIFQNSTALSGTRGRWWEQSGIWGRSFRSHWRPAIWTCSLWSRPKRKTSSCWFAGQSERWWAPGPSPTTMPEISCFGSGPAWWFPWIPAAYRWSFALFRFRRRRWGCWGRWYWRRERWVYFPWRCCCRGRGSF